MSIPYQHSQSVQSILKNTTISTHDKAIDIWKIYREKRRRWDSAGHVNKSYTIGEIYSAVKEYEENELR